MNFQDDKDWYSTKVEDALTALATNPKGLSDAEVLERRKTYGSNELTQKKKKTILQVILSQFKDVMIIVLIAAAFMAIIFGVIEKVMGNPDWVVELIEGLVIFLIVVLNGVIGAVQEIKASSALDALKKIGAPTARVVRGGETIVIPTSEIVLGDIVYIEDGSIVPADLRLMESSNLKIQESSLTGESVPVEKNSKLVFDKSLPLGDRKNMCYSSSIVTYGNGVGIVVGIGMKTEVGKIATMLNDQEEVETPIKQKLNKVGKILSIIGAITAILVLAIGFGTLSQGAGWKDFHWIEPLMLAITLAVAVIPEGLPATATIVMSLGVQRMAKKNAIVRKLPVVETLGNATVICSDKTGTLTLNRMTVVNILTMDDIEQKHYTTLEEAAEKPERYQDVVLTSILCNNASISEKDPTTTIGDPTEGALLNLAPFFHLNVHDLKTEHRRTSEQPFDSDRKLMSTVNEYRGQEFVFTKGAAEELLHKCTHVLTEKGIRPKTLEDEKGVQAAIEEMSSKALRILGYAKTEVQTSRPEKDFEHDLVFIGLTGMIDPPRKEVIAAIQTCHEAGIRTIMITGDHKVTARVIATELHIFEEGNTVISGDELDKMTDAQLDESIKTTTVFARVSPASKLRIVKALQANKEIVAMTGDGVNDAPALKSANIGVAMGITGTDVAKDASDMILLDDNYTTIGNAIFEGRRIYRNIQKVIQYLIAGNVAEILVVLVIFIAGAIATATGATFHGHEMFPEVLNPIQLLIINLVTETIPCIALGLDAAEKDIMKRKASLGNNLFEKSLLVRVVWQGSYLFILSLIGYCLGSFVLDGNMGGSHEYNGMTMAFLVIAISQSFHVFNMRSDKLSIFSKNNPRNNLLILLSIASMAIIVMLAMISMYAGNAYKILGMNHMGWQPWLATVGLSISIVPAVELAKVLKIN